MNSIYAKKRQVLQCCLQWCTSVRYICGIAAVLNHMTSWPHNEHTNSHDTRRRLKYLSTSCHL